MPAKWRDRRESKVNVRMRPVTLQWDCSKKPWMQGVVQSSAVGTLLQKSSSKNQFQIYMSRLGGRSESFAWIMFVWSVLVIS